MLARCSISRVSTHTTHIRIVSRIKTSRGHVRRLASTAATADASQGASLSGLPVFGGLSTELDKLAPRFEIEPDQIDILREPKDFYEALKVSDLEAEYGTPESSILRVYTIQSEDATSNHRENILNIGHWRSRCCGLSLNIIVPDQDIKRQEPYLYIDSIHWQDGAGARKRTGRVHSRSSILTRD